MEVGFALEDITPPLGVFLGGQLHERRANAVESNLYARAMCVKSDKSVVLIAACDLLLLTVEMADCIRKSIAESIPISIENILIATTHTHSGPITGEIFGMEMENDYLEVLPDKIKSAACAAYKNLQPARLLVTSTKIEGLAFNRRFIMKDGTVQTHPQKGDPNIVNVEGPDDPEIGIIYAVNNSGNYLGAVINFACHPTMMERESTGISADYPGYVCKAMERMLGPGSKAVFLNGACGNICQVNPLNISNKEVGAEWAKYMGEAIAQASMEAIRNGEGIEQTRLTVSSDVLSVPMREISEEMILDAQESLKTNVEESPRLSDYGTEEKHELAENVLSLADLLETNFWKRLEAVDLLAVWNNYKENPNVGVPITIIKGDSLALIALPCELFVEFGLELKHKSPFKHTFISELTNGWVGYLPTDKAFSRYGGYETKHMSTSSLSQTAGRSVVDYFLSHNFHSE